MRDWLKRLLGQQNLADWNDDLPQLADDASEPALPYVDPALLELGFVPQWHAQTTDGSWILRPTTSAIVAAPRTRLLADVWDEEAEKIEQAGGVVLSAGNARALFAVLPPHASEDVLAGSAAIPVRRVC